MCIVLVTTAHPSYSLIVLDNRDEFVLRPTSRPHWWTSDLPENQQEILSARDLQRAEHGTWLGVTKSGKLAVLTNFREDEGAQSSAASNAARSRGAMVTAWLKSSKEEGTRDFVHRLLSGDGVKGVGGFSLVCGKLQRHRDGGKELDPLAIVSNRSGSADDVPWIAGKRGEVYGLSNTSYDDPVAWPKVEIGKDLVVKAVNDAVELGLGEEELVERLWVVLDTNTLPDHSGKSFEETVYHLRKSIFIHAIGGDETAGRAPKAEDIAAAEPSAIALTARPVRNEQLPEIPKEGETKSVVTSAPTVGVYGTMRQTILLVDWNGNVSFRERSLWDDEGNPIERGAGDLKFEYQIDGWN